VPMTEIAIVQELTSRREISKSVFDLSGTEKLNSLKVDG
jgi:hypothetical protein